MWALVLAWMAGVSFVANGQEPQLAPLNPAFTEWLDAKSNVATRGRDTGANGYVPPPTDSTHLRTAPAAPTTSRGRALPSFYDLRVVTGKLPAIRNQGSYGTCWAFATCASIETLLRPADTTVDLSEKHMAHKHGFLLGYDDGGNRNMAAAYLARWSGPVSEADCPYTNVSVAPPSGLVPTLHVQDIEYLPVDDRDAIKQAVMTHGAVSISYRNDNGYYRDVTYDPPDDRAAQTVRTFFRSSADATSNHGVSIVGWDDAFPASNFTATPSGNGAWIIRNSWGSWGPDGGYFFLSYYEGSIEEPTSVTLAEQTDNYDFVHSYDPFGRTSALGLGSHSLWGANLFTSENRQELRAVGVFLPDHGASYDIRVYTGCNAGSPASGTYQSSAQTTGTKTYAGFYTIPLAAAVPLASGQRFSVLVNFTTPAYDYPLPVERPITDYANATANAGESYYSSTGFLWTDLPGKVTDANVCIKAYTADQEPEVDLQGDGVSIPDGKTAVDVADLTDFGSVPGATSATHEFHVLNLGSGLLSITSASIDDGGANAFSLDASALATSLDTGEQTVFSVTFAPVEAGTVSATVTVLTNDADETPYTFTVQGTGTGAPEMDVFGNGLDIGNNDSTPSAADHTDFGDAIIDGDPVIRTFTVANSGNLNLSLTATPLVSVTGPNADEFVVSSQPASTVAAGGSTTFTVTFTPADVGVRTASVSIGNNDSDENPYTFSIQGNGVAVPEIDVQGKGIGIADGDTTPAAADDTEFGEADTLTGSVVHTFTIANTGLAELTLTGTPLVAISGAQASDFTVSTDPDATVASGGSTTFQITFDPTAAGIRAATVSIANDDSDENPYTFAVQGTGTVTPDIDVQGNGVSIANGDGAPTTGDHTDFGEADMFGGTVVRTFTIANTGSGTLSLSGTPLVAVSGPAAAEFTLTSPPASSVGPGGSTTFQITFDPGMIGTRTATLSIASDDPDETPYTFAVQGTGTFVAEDELPVRRGLLMQLDASTLTGYADGDPVSLWPDQSGLGHNGAPVGADGTPTYAAAAIGGRPAVRFDGVNNNMVVGRVREETGPLELLMVASGPTTTGSTWQRLVSAWSGIEGENDWTGASWQISRPNDSGTPRVFTPRIFRIDYASDHEIDNLTFAAASQYPTNNNLDGDIAEILLYSQQLTNEERSKVGAYLQHKYGIAPTYNHPGTATIRAEAVSGLTTTGVTLAGTLDSSGDSPAEVRLYYGTADGGESTASWDEMVVVATDQSGMSLPQSVSLSNLVPDTAYFARFAASNGSGLSFSTDVLTFTTTPPTVSVGDCIAYEGGDAPVATFTVSLSQPWGADTTVQYTTVDGTAQAGSDYTARTDSLVIPAETLAGTVTVSILIDDQSEPSEQFQLQVTDAGGSAIADDTGVCTLVDVYTDYYVATDGDDANPGTIDEPFATIEHARDALSGIYAMGTEPTDGITVWLRGGRYELADSITFGEADAGTADAPITYRGYPGEEVRLTGGKLLESSWFSPVTGADPVWPRLDATAQGAVYQADLSANGITDFGTLNQRGFGKAGVLGALELFAADAPQQIARWPNGEGFSNIGTVLSTTQFTYTGTRPERWTQAEEPWAHGYWYQDWADEHIGIGSIDTAGQTIALAGEHNYGLKAGQPYYVYNLLEEIDLPGEWYLNRTTGILYYWPASPLGNDTLEVSLLETPLLHVTGASHLRFADLVLECTRGELVRIGGGQDNRVEHCTLRNCGTNAAVVYGTDNGLDACTITETGAGGATINGGDRKTLTDAGNFVTNCDIDHFGRWCWTYAPAVRPTGCGLVVEHNHIWHAPHTAILFNGNHISVKYNHIHDVCRFSADAGSIYTGRDWGDRGNEVSYNFIHHIDSTFDGYGVHGIYLDDMSSGITVHGNILYEISGYGVQHGGGRDDLITNNVFKNCGYGDRADCRGMNWAYSNINARAQDSWDLLNKLRPLDYQSAIWAAAFPECAAIPNDYDLAYDKANGWLTPGGSILERNVYCNLTNGIQYSNDGAFAYYASIADNVEVCDSLFVDESALNMTIAPDSAALLVDGFEDIPFSQIGPLREIDVQGNGISIASGDDTPQTADHTDFGTGDTGGAAVVRTFTIANPGSAPLTLSGTPLVAISGTNAADFAITAEPASTIAAGGATTFQVSFQPSDYGLRTATITVASNDIDEATYTFAIQGTGVWRSALYPTDWTPATTDAEGRFLPDFGYAGYHGGMEPLPAAPPGPIVDATQAPYNADNTGSTDATAAIQQALDTVGQSGGGVVYLPAGTYLVSLPDSQSWALRIRYPRTVLRGAGTGQTYLECTSTDIRSANIVLVQPDVGYVLTELEGTSHLLTSDAANRGTSVDLESVGNLAVGDRVVLRADWTQEFIDEHGMTGVWVPSSSMSASLFFRRIVAIDGTTVTLDTPIRYPLKTRDNARLYRCPPFLREVGLEDFSIGNRQNPNSGWGDTDYAVAGTGAYEVHGSHLVRFYHVWDGWMRRVNTFRPASNTRDVHALSNIAIASRSRFVTFADCVVQKPQYEGGGGNGYGLSFQDANDCLFTSCEVIHTRHNYDFKTAGSNGNVIHRSAGRTSRYASDFHMYLSMGNLLDCMTMDDDFLECRYRPYGAGPNYHGHAGTQNVFWNTYGTSGRTDKVVESRQYGYGYVIGTQGETTNVVLTPIDTKDTSPIDWSEGIGTSDHLQPQSLYEDQLSRRAALLPAIDNSAGATTVTHDSATLNGTLTSEGSGAVQAILYWGTTDGGMMPEAWEQAIDLGAVSAGPLAVDLTYLLPDTTYHYRLLATNADGEDWANTTASFTTGSGPAIRNAGPSLLTTTSADFRAELFASDADVTLYWGLVDGGTDAGSWTHAVGPTAQTVGTFTINATGLPVATTIYYRWYADAAGTGAWSPASATLDTTPSLSVANVEVQEGDGTATFTISLTPASTVDTTVDVATVDGTAIAGQDYTAVSQTITIQAGDASETVPVAILDNHTVETYRERFQLVLSNPVNAKLGTGTALGTIVDDDLPQLPITDGLVLHLDANALLGSLADGDTVTTWPDTSGSGNDATSDSGSPTFRVSSLHTRPTFEFNGVDDTFVSPSIRPELGPVTFFLVSEKDLPDGSNWQRLMACDNGATNEWEAPSWAISPPRGDGGVPLAYDAKIDGRRYASGYGIAPIRIARLATSVGGWYKGKIAELVVYDRCLSVDEYDTVAAWLNAKYSIASTTVAPEIAVSGLGTDIADGDTTPDTTDNTEFGDTDASVTHTFQISNLGMDELVLSSVTVDSEHFSVSAPPASTSLAPGGSTTFQITFAPHMTGSQTGTVTIVSNDADESPFTFAVAGNGVGSPEIDITGNGVSIADGDASPSVADHTDFGTVTVGSGFTRSFTVHNAGPFWLHLGSLDLAGPDASSFSLDTSGTATALAAGESTTFSVTFRPTTPRLCEASVSLANDDADETPYDFAIQGIGSGPEIEVSVDDSGTSSGDTLDFGALDLDDAPVSKSITVTNTGNRDLTLFSTSLSGTHTTSFPLSGLASGTVLAAGESTTFSIAFDPTVTNVNSASFVLNNSDPSEGSYALSLTGIGTDAPVASAATAVTNTGFTANWSSVPNADGYRLDVATDSGFAALVSGYDDRDVGTDTNCVLSGLATGTHYYYRVRAIFSTAASADSNTVRVARAVGVPTAFTNPLTGQDVLGGQNLAVAWGVASDADGDAITYDLEFYDGTAWDSLASDLTEPSYTHLLPGAADLTTVKYRVRANADGDTSDWAESDAFHLDGVAPTVLSVAVSPAGRYRLGDTLVFTVSVSEDVVVTGSPTLSFTLASGQVSAAYDGDASSATSLVFSYQVQASDDDTDGIGIDTLATNGGTIRDAAGNDLDLALQSIADASGITIHGGTLVFHVDATGGDDANDGRTWGTAMQSLQTALGATVEGDQIWVKEGTHVPGAARTDAFALRNGIGVYGGFAGDETSLDQRDIAGNPTILSGDIGTPGDAADNCYHVILNPASAEIDDTTILDGFTILGGQADGPGESEDSGGGMLNLGASPIIRNCLFRDNHAAVAGGALCNQDNADVRVENCTFVDNSTGDNGGAVHNQASAPAFVNCTFVGNLASSGGAAYCSADSPAQFVSCTFTGNASAVDASATDVTLLNCIFWGNGGDHGIAGGILDSNIAYCVVQGGGIGDGTCSSKDPHLLPLADNGGPVPTVGLGHLSSALDTGTASGTPGTDARGVPRPFGTGPDIGAYEAGVPLLAASTPVDNATDVPLDTNLVLTFQCNVTPVAGKALSLRVVGGGNVETFPATAANVTVVDNTVTIDPTADLLYGTHYCLQIEAGAFTGSGNTPALADETTLDFTTPAPPVYTVDFVGDGTPGVTFNGTTSQNVTHGNDATPVEANAPAGYHFVNWTLTGSEYSTANPLTVLTVTSSLTFVANFAPNQYTWTFQPGDHGDLDAGDPTVAMTVTFGEDAPTPPAVTPEAGYSHADWSPAIPATVPVGNQTFTATYTPNQYTWTFQPGGHGSLDAGDPNVTMTVTFGEDAPTPPTITPSPGYSHAGWTPDIPATVPVGDLTFAATYTANQYTWTFQPGAHGSLDAGDPDVTMTVTFGDDAPTPPAVTPNAGYSHAGWNPVVPTTVGVGDQTFAATYTANQYTWTFQPGDHGTLDAGDPNVTMTVTFGEDAPPPPAVTPAAGYSQVGWAPAIPATVPVGDQTFAATYAPNQYTWTFLPGEHGTLDAGDPNVTVTVTFGEDAPTPPTVTPSAGYSHLDWTPAIPATVPVGDQTFTATYTANQYTWTFQPGEHGTLDAGDPNVTMTVTFGEDAPTPPTVTADAGYSHSSWAPAIPTTVPVGDQTFVATYTPNQYTWTFQPGEHGTLDAGDPNVTMTVTFGEDAPPPPTVNANAGYSHSSWTPNIPATVPVGDRTFTATYTPNQYTWTFQPGEHGTLDGGTPKVTVTVTFDGEVPPPPLVIPDAGYSHAGWEPVIPQTIPVGDQTFTASYTPNQYVWTFHPGEHGSLDAGDPDVTVTVTFGEDAPTPPAVTPDAGYSHSSWTPNLPGTVPVGDQTFTATYTPNQYVWTFQQGDHGSLDAGSPDVTMVVTFGEDAPTPPAVTPDEGYTHSGWGPAIPATVPVGDQTFAATYTANQYTWTFQPGEHGSLDGGSPDVVVTVTFGEDAPSPPAATPDAGYSHSGWSTTIPATVPVGDQSFTATYTPNQYAWTFQPGDHGDLIGGTPDVVITVTFGEDAPAPPTVAPDAGYSHAGWEPGLPATVPVGDQTFVATYTPNQYTWLFQPGAHGTLDDGTPDVAITVTFGEESPPLPTVTPDAGYSHSGWSATIPETIPVGNKTFVAAYTPNQYTWRYRAGAHGHFPHPNDGDDITAQLTFGGTPAHPYIIPDYGWRQIGWTPEPPATVGVGERSFTVLYGRVKDQPPTAGYGLCASFARDGLASAEGILPGIRSIQLAVRPLARCGQLFDLGNGVSASIATGAVTVSTPARIYINGSIGVVLAEDRWNLVTIVLDNAVDATNPTFADGLLGDLDEVALWTAPLTAETVTNWLYRMPDIRHPNWDSLAAWYRFEEDSATCENAASPNACDLTLTNVVQAKGNVREWWGTTNGLTSLEGRLIGGWNGGCTSDGTDWTIQFELLVRPAHGTLSIPDPFDNRFIYTPDDPDVPVQDCFQYRTNKDGHRSAPATVDIAWESTNHAPFLFPDSQLLATIDDEAPPFATSVAGLLGDTTTDVDGDPVGIVLLTALTPTGGGTWSYSMDGETWQPLPHDLGSYSALPLPGQALLRFSPVAAATGEAQLLYRAWDGTSGAPDVQSAVYLVGGGSAFSAAMDTATLRIREAVAAPAEVWVGNWPDDSQQRGTPTFASIADGLAAVEANGTIHLAPGVYEENLVVAKPVSLAGAGAEDTILLGSLAAVTVVAGGALDLSGLTISAPTGLALVDGSLGLVRDCDFLGCETGVRATGGDLAGSISQCCFADNAAGVANETGTDLDCRNCWWGNATGPSGEGPGTGDSVSAHVLFDPWSATSDHANAATGAQATGQTLQELADALPADCQTLYLIGTTTPADFNPPDGIELVISSPNAEHQATAESVTLDANDRVRVVGAAFQCGERVNAGLFEMIGSVGTLHVDGSLTITGTERWLGSTVQIASTASIVVQSGGRLEVEDCDLELETGVSITVEPGASLSLLGSSVSGGSVVLQGTGAEVRACLFDHDASLAVGGTGNTVRHNAFVAATVSDTGIGTVWQDAAWGNAWPDGVSPAGVGDLLPALWEDGALYGTIGISWQGAADTAPFTRATVLALDGAGLEPASLTFAPVATDSTALAFWQLAAAAIDALPTRVSAKPELSLRAARERQVSRSPVFDFLPADNTEPAPGDLDGDNRVDNGDLDILRATWNGTDPAGDLNADGTVDMADYQLLRLAYGHAGDNP
jgi:C1A family cysteine protease